MSNLQQLNLFDYLDGGKTCKKCKNWKPFVKFTKCAGCIGGRAHICLACSNDPEKVRARDRERYKKRAEYMKAKTRAWSAANAERKALAGKQRYEANKEIVLAEQKEYYQKNKKAINERSKIYREAHIEEARAAHKRYAIEKGEELRAKKREYHAKNKDKAIAYAKENRERQRPIRRACEQRREARKKGIGGTFTAKEWIALCEKYDHKCLCCGEEKPLTIDHIVPISKGGRNSIENLQPLCVSCNSRKNTKTIDYRPKEQD